MKSVDCGTVSVNDDNSRVSDDYCCTMPGGSGSIMSNDDGSVKSGDDDGRVGSTNSDGSIYQQTALRVNLRKLRKPA
jgi:hypothetical protein